MPRAMQEEITRLQEEYSRNPEGRLFVHLAEAYRRSGELERARGLLREGLEQHGNYVSARILLAQVEEEMDDSGRARAAWQDVLREDDENELALRALARMEEQAGNTVEALQYCRRLAELGVVDDELLQQQQRLQGGGEEDAQPASEPEIAVLPPLQAEVHAAEEPQQPAAAGNGARPRQARRPVTSAREEPASLPAHTDAVGLTDLLVRLLEHDGSTFHAEASLTRLLALSIGRELELERTHLDALALAALLGNVGGLAFSGAEPAEARGRDGAQRQVAITLQLLQGLTLPAGVHDAIRYQHERWDGGGFPEGLRDDEIPYTARVLAVARECARRLTRIRPGASVGVWEAIDDLQREAGSRFDPVIVSVLRRVFQRRAEHGIGFGLGGRVILVHPEELRALGLATQLHGNGYVTEMTAETAAARTRMRTHPAEALVLGAHIPGSDVARFIREVRSNPEWSRVPVVVIDANDMDLRVDLLTAGADVCFPSEVNYREFKATLDALLRRREDAPQSLTAV